MGQSEPAVSERDADRLLAGYFLKRSTLPPDWPLSDSASPRP